MDVECFQQIGKITAPRESNINITDRIFHNQSPADNPGEYLPERNVSVSIGTSGNRNTGCEFCIAHCCESAGNCTNDVQNHNAGTTGKTCVPNGTECSAANDSRNPEEC